MGRFFRQDDEGSSRIEARLLRWDAALCRSEAGLQRAQAARQRLGAARGPTKSARDHIDDVHERCEGLPRLDADERERLADWRDAAADERERLADRRDAAADERERLADRREAVADERERLADQRKLAEDMRRPKPPFRRSTLAGESFTPGLVHLGGQGARLRVQGAELADQMADMAEWFAAHMEHAATRCDFERRIAVAGTEREIARIGRQTAARLRDVDSRYETGQHLPRFPRTGPASRSPSTVAE